MEHDNSLEIPKRKKIIWKWVKRALVTFVVAILAVALLSATWHSRRTRLAEKRNPPLGQMVDVGGHKLHFHIRGRGPLVVMDSGNGDAGSYGWFGAEKKIAEFAKVLTYDRAGVGWSGAGPGPRTNDIELNELRELLRKANLQPPYVLVGHSRGGFNMRLFASTYPDEVAGLILVDAFCTDSFPDNAMDGSIPLLERVIHAGRHFGMARVFYNQMVSVRSPDIGPESFERYIDMQSRSSNFEGFIEQSSGAHSNWLELRSRMKNLGDKPVIVISPKLTANRYGWSWWPQSQQALAKNVGNNVEVLKPNCGHHVPAEAPGVLVDAVKRMIDRIGQLKSP